MVIQLPNSLSHTGPSVSRKITFPFWSHVFISLCLYCFSRLCFFMSLNRSDIRIFWNLYVPFDEFIGAIVLRTWRKWIKMFENFQEGVRVMVFNSTLKICNILTLTVTDEDYSRNASWAKAIIGKVVTKYWINQLMLFRTTSLH